jgi:DnaJ-class molecular chaperone
MNTDAVTRLEIIDHSPCKNCLGVGYTYVNSSARTCEQCDGAGFAGRKVIMFDKNKKIDIQLQDDDRTLKIFVSDRDE